MFKEIQNKFRGYRYELSPRMLYSFSRPMVLFHSDDWGLLGIKDKELFNKIADKYSLDDGSSHLSGYGFESPEDLYALFDVLERHVDSRGRHPSIVCNFILANIDFQHVVRNEFKMLKMKPIKDGFSVPWSSSDRIIDIYKDGISRSLMYPSMHGVCHFCFKAIETVMKEDSIRGETQRALLSEGIPFSYATTPWAGFEFKDEAEVTGSQWLSPIEQSTFIRQGVEYFCELFGFAPVSACAPGYRANPYTYDIWEGNGIKIVHTGPYHAAAPVKGPYGLIYLQRNVEFEPSISPVKYSVDKVLKAARSAIEKGFPAVISTHSVNFHSSVINYRDLTLRLLDGVLTGLEKMYPDLLYVTDSELLDIMINGTTEINAEKVRIRVNRKLTFSNYIKGKIKKPKGSRK